MNLEICRDIAPEDDMFAGNREHYFSVGESALKNILISLDLADRKKCLSILDFPSGYGRVLRYLKATFPDAKITACELEKNAVDFCTKVFGVRGVYSEKNLKNLHLDDKFDLIWCGSLFTHLDKHFWPLFLSFFYDHLIEGGVLVFTTHGRCVASRMKNEIYNYGIAKDKINLVYDSFEKNGFGYSNYPNSDDYGISLSNASWVFSELEKFKDLNIVLFSENCWDNHQDVIACKKENAEKKSSEWLNKIK